MSITRLPRALSGGTAQLFLFAARAQERHGRLSKHWPTYATSTAKSCCCAAQKMRSSLIPMPRATRSRDAWNMMRSYGFDHSQFCLDDHQGLNRDFRERLRVTLAMTSPNCRSRRPRPKGTKASEPGWPKSSPKAAGS